MRDNEWTSTKFRCRRCGEVKDRTDTTRPMINGYRRRNQRICTDCNIRLKSKKRVKTTVTTQRSSTDTNTIKKKRRLP